MELEEQKTLRTRIYVSHGAEAHDKAEKFTEELIGKCYMNCIVLWKTSVIPQQLIDSYHEVNLRGMLSVSRKQCDNPHAVTAYDVINEEYYEFLEAVIKKDKAEALKELAQVMAMCLRVGLHLEHYLGTEDHREQRGETVQKPT